ncbi:tyrosine recombinase XerD [Methanobrevibacter cuticularis]|uniref:Tyrosine recombinase XerD n=1 Tax=Methanobrevibacter cuticularis TaxID=47311 RepID=A0A166EJP2_9EURY|nr:tyrosine-type recombinase/integrase [Methanobrevibacter cuticularis]KZX16730.1 tyrosine recombinase XerD [Methanobrevibacter cuticularis]
MLKWAIKTDKRLKEQGKSTNYQEKLTPHTPRHSSAIYLLNIAKRPMNEVQQLLGHTNIATTQIYTRVDNEDMKMGYKSIKW